MMHGLRRTLFQRCRHLHVLSRDGPSETLKKKVSELEKLRRRKNHKKDQVFVEVPEPRSYLDTATMPMILTAVGGALFAKLLMMYDDSKSQDMIERKIRNAPEGQGIVRMLDREEWEEIKDVRPRTPFESKLARPNARIRTGEPLHMEDLKDWTIDVCSMMHSLELKKVLDSGPNNSGFNSSIFFFPLSISIHTIFIYKAWFW